MKRLRQLEEENGKSKKIVADPSLDKVMLQDVIRRKTLKPVRQRQMVDHVRSTWRGSSVRMPCAAGRSTYHYRYRRAGQDQL
jgi:putative transposase